MRHQWKEIGWLEKSHPLGPEERVCKNCGARQTLHREYLWQRVVRRRWLPLVGRCKKEVK